MPFRMTVLPAPSLIARFALFYCALSLLALLLVKSTVLWLEFRELVEGLDRGALERATAEVAADLSQSWGAGEREPAMTLERALESVLLRLEHPSERIGGEGSNVLNELSAQPLAARIVTPDGSTLASAPAGSAWSAGVPGTNDAWWARDVVLIAREPPPALRMSYAAPLHDRGGTLRGALLVELRLSVPWAKLLLSGSLEWPILLMYLVVFGAGSALFLSWYVTRRLRRIEAAASAWSRGDFSSPIDDGSPDELGRLANRLNRMAADLRTLVQTRGQLATLEERQRLARDLHDTVKQKAFALNLQLATATRLLGAGAPAVGAKIDEARRITEEIQTELVQILDELRVAGQPHAFAGLLAAKVGDFARRTGIATEAGIAAATQVPPEQHEAIARIVDEALANVLRHSGARHVRVGIERADEGFVLEVVDDGCGPMGDRGTGMGIRNMRARAASLPAGRFDIGGDDTGTRVRVSWRDRPESEPAANLNRATEP